MIPYIYFLPISMFLLFVIGGCVIIIAIIVVIVKRLRLTKQSEQLSAKIGRIPSYESAITNDGRKEAVYAHNERFSVDIITDLETSFAARYITFAQEKEFTCYYADYYQEANALVPQLKKFSIEPSDVIVKFLHDFDNIGKLVRLHNQQVIQNSLDRHKLFFDHCLKYPLDEQQRRSIVSEEDNCLVVSSAGSGKTSSIVGKVKYLIEIKKVDPTRILLISYTNKAAAELTERMGIEGLRGYTFHKLALDLIGQQTGNKPSICDNTDALFVKIYRDLLADSRFRKHAVEYFVDYQANEADWEKRKNERRQQLSEQKDVRLKAMVPDMDGKQIYVRSEQEQKICFVLSSLGVQFRYEEPYERPVADAMHSQYRPDFSIYFERDGKPQRLYLEHFGVDEHGFVPAWFAKDRNISYEEANQKYNDGITWKRAAHEKFGTRLITTSSVDFYRSDIRETVKASYSWTQFVKEMETRGYVWRTDRKYLALKAPGMERYVRLRSLGKGYGEMEIREWILRPKIRETEKVYLQWSKQRKKRTGLQALYYSYLYQMGVFQKKPKRIPYEVREDIRRLDQRIAQIEFLQKQDISTLEQLQEFRHPLEEKMAQLLLERGQLYRSQPGCERIGKITEEMKQIRKDIRMSLRIEQYSVEMEQRMKRAKERMEQAEKNMQRKKEQIKESYVK